MALSNTLRSAHRFNYQIVLSLYGSRMLKRLLPNNSTFVEIDDALDAFTTQLVQKKSDKWGSLNVNGSLPTVLTDALTEKSNIDNVKYLTTKEIDLMFQDALDEFDKNKISLLVRECINHKNCPSVSLLVNILSFCAQEGDIEGIKDIKELCKDVHPDFVFTNSDFHHYLAEAIWLKGNIMKALELFDTVYKTNTFLRRSIRLTLRYLIYDAIKNRSEAVTVPIIKFCENLYKQYKDSYLLIILWQVCFLSEWYTDQCIALKLMEKNIGFCKIVLNHIPYVVSASLKNHKTEPVYMLLEILLKYDFKMQCSIILISLFDYRYRQGDLMRCIEIYNWSTKYHVFLPTIQHEKFLKLLLHHDEESTKNQKQFKAQAPNYHLKF